MGEPKFYVYAIPSWGDELDTEFISEGAQAKEAHLRAQETVNKGGYSEAWIEADTDDPRKRQIVITYVPKVPVWG